MNKIIFFTIVFFSLWNYSSAQKFYNTTSGELIFGFSNASYDATNISDLPNSNIEGSIQGPIRFTLWFHFGNYWHYDFNNNIGFYSGFSNRNIGFITSEKATANSNGLVETSDNVKWKRRAYAAGIPLVLKIGSFEDDFYFFAGGQMEFLYHYKEKEFKPSGKRKYSEWFSSRVNKFLPSIFIGVAFPQGTNIKFTYELDDMMNRNYSFTDGNGVNKYPYKHMSSQLFYFSVFQMVRWDNKTKIKENKEHNKIAIL